jgi:hypothetical protein
VVARTKGLYWSALYQRLATSREGKRAIYIVTHSMVVRACHRLSGNESY